MKAVYGREKQWFKFVRKKKDVMEELMGMDSFINYTKLVIFSLSLLSLTSYAQAWITALSYLPPNTM